MSQVFSKFHVALNSFKIIYEYILKIHLPYIEIKNIEKLYSKKELYFPISKKASTHGFFNACVLFYLSKKWIIFQIDSLRKKVKEQCEIISKKNFNYLSLWL